MPTDATLVTAVRADLMWLLTAWRQLLFSSESNRHPVRARWSPQTTRERVGFWVWSALGAVLIGVTYPFVVAGFWVRYVTHRLNQVATGLGLLALLAAVGVAWSALTALAWGQLPAAGFKAVLTASVVATGSAGLAWAAARTGGRRVTFVVAYPFAVAAIFLPPVTAALFSPTLGEIILPRSTSLAAWILDNLLVVGNLSTVIRQQFDLSGLAFVAMWSGLAAPIGWLLGLLVTLANAVRPRDGGR
ncbi:hypothetical protein SAMN04488065_2867 [Haloplanus vescus]|uniref:Uncharacterized protein n=1 Tax=Haloplanus vescus TaxID=555874 RepID=A0A1H4AP53_9EURY|nr:hypothetical protein [Haloplanus vescus]SEA37588.1 hypothetical protein SAMN04488065_2867 [Haloplanus vescus]